MDKFKLISSDEKRGVWINEMELIKLIKLCNVRNTKMFAKLVNHYEYLTGRKFDLELIK